MVLWLQIYLVLIIDDSHEIQCKILLYMNAAISLPLGQCIWTRLFDRNDIVTVNPS